MRTAVVLMLLVLACGSAQAQTVSFGVSAGVPLSPLMTAAGNQAAATGWYTLGPALGVGLPRGFGLDLELLYKRFDLGFAANPARAVVRRMELPVMLRYRLSRLPVRAFVHAGMSFNRIIGVGGVDVCGQGAFGETIYCIADKTAAELRHRHTHGAVLGIGLGLRWKRLGLAPELRVTRWVDRNFGTRGSLPRSNLTGIEMLMGIKF